MNRNRTFRNIAFIISSLFLAGVLHAEQKKAEAPIAKSDHTTKTRTELLNELSLREALVSLENPCSHVSPA